MIPAGGFPKWLAAVALALAAACAGASEDGRAGEVASVFQELGGFKELINVGLEPPMDLGTTYSVFRNQPSEASCAVAGLVDTRTGAPVSLPSLPSCVNMTAAMTFSNSVFVADQRGAKIYRFVTIDQGSPPGGAGGCPGTSGPPGGFGGAGGCPSPSPPAAGGTGGGAGWATFTDTNHAVIQKMVSNGSFLFWYDGENLHRNNLNSGQSTLSTLPFQGRLLAVEGSAIYVNVALDGGSSYELRSYAWTGNNPTLTRVLGSSTTSFDSWFSFDANKFYWVADISGTSQVLSLPKAGGSVSVVRSSTSVRYLAPLSNGSAFYWLDENVSDGTMSIHRKNLSNGNVVSTAFPFDLSTPVSLLSDGIYFAPYFSSPAHWSLYRTAL